MSNPVNKGAVKFKSIRAMARSLAAKTGENEDKVYIRLYMRLRMGQNASQAFHKPAREYRQAITA